MNSMTPFSMKIGESWLLIDIFCMIAMQNRVHTELAVAFCVVGLCLFKSFMILIKVTRIFFPFVIKYSTPLSVLAITLMKLKMACYRPGCLIFRRSMRNWSLTLLYSMKTSFLTSSYIRFFLSSGDICNAFTLRDNKTSTIPLTLPCVFAWISLFLCSVITASLNSLVLSALPSDERI